MKMELISVSSVKLSGRPLTLGIGKFDGFHLGHQEIVRRILQSSASSGTFPAVFTFRNFPAPFHLYPWKERTAALARSGIRLCIWSDFSGISSWTPERFLSFLETAGVRELVVGFNFVFGAGRRGNVDILRRESENGRFRLTVVEPFLLDGEPVNSTGVRRSLLNGDVEQAARLLGRYFSLAGEVMHGAGRGRGLGSPTINLSVRSGVNVTNGVYAGWALFGGELFKAAISIGVCPTFGGTGRKVEAFLLDEDRNLYGTPVTLFFAFRVREQRCFTGAGALKEQIGKDVALIRSRVYPPPEIDAGGKKT